MRVRVALLLVALVAAAAVLPSVLPSGSAGDASPDRGRLAGSAPGAPTAAEEDQPRQTSDGLAGEVVDPTPTYLRGRRTRIDNKRGWRVARGVTFRRWDRTDRRGQVRLYLLTVDTRMRGVKVDYAMDEHVPDRAPLTSLLVHDEKAVAGVNGGFFDIYDTGAPLGVGQDRQRGFLHAARYTWRNAFWIDRRGRARIGVVPLAAEIAEHPEMEIANVNHPRVREQKIGIWDASWGRTSGYSVTDGQKKNVRMVVVEDGRVVSSSRRLPSGQEITGTVLVGRGPGAKQLARLPVGSKATVRWSLGRSARFALGGETVLVRRGRVKAREDRILHPRTAVGIDHDTGRILLLAADGRQPHSRGLTMLELARQMKKLGAEVALNLDGGGSTTVAGHDRRGRMRVLNRPSDGYARSVPDGIVVLSR